MTLRVLPRLTLAVTSEEVRRRKRWAMFVAGLVAFALYRGAKRLWPLDQAIPLLAVSGAICAMGALVAYRVGRGTGWRSLWHEDGISRLGWMAGWIGAAYGVQLSLLVLALLKFVAQYDFLRHPDGPAMMAVIIACTSVVRDSFEIGHVRRLQADGTPILTFPSGAALRALLAEQPRAILQWAGAAGVVCAAAAAASASAGGWGGLTLVQLALTTLLAGSLMMPAFLGGELPGRSWQARFGMAGPFELFRFWWWPGLAFAATYYLVAAGALAFVFPFLDPSVTAHGLVAAGVGGLMGAYGYYLGHRRQAEDRIERAVPAALLRCPFVMNLLSSGGSRARMALGPAEAALGEAGRRG